jgi:hypothetical protein
MKNYGEEVLLAILARSFARNVWHGTPGEFRKAHPTLVEAAFKTLSLLELVELDRDSPWGYRPTRHLTSQLLDPLVDSDKENIDEEDRKVLTKIIQASEKPELWEGGKSLSNMLVVLRFAHWREGAGELIPHESLHMQMIYAGHFDQGGE